MHKKIMSILVTGGAGYIGSVVVDDLLAKGVEVIVIDNLVHGHRAAIDSSVPFYKGDIGDRAIVRNILQNHEITGCMHFSAFACVGESLEDPRKYFENNVTQTLGLLDSLLESGVRQFVFSSTCATYGEPVYNPIDEKHPQDPTSPYGWSKLMIERVLESYSRAYDFNFVALRYFNAAGATEKRRETHEPETHLIPLLLDTAIGKRDSISLFGDDYPTPDGTAIRDYIHVSDLSQAHLSALEYLFAGGESTFINLGNGNGYSVKEVIKAARRISGREIEVKVAPRRAGDPSHLIAEAGKAREVLGWIPGYIEIDAIIESAWKWYG
jgi:UDP-glucose 4-epimerase